MRPWICGLVGLTLLGCGGKEGDLRTQKSGALSAAFAPVPDPPRVGHDSGVAVTLSDAGNPVTGATVNVATFFRGLNQTGPTAVCMETAPGRYEARELSMGMGGKWEAVVTVSRASQPDAKFTFPFTVAK